MAKKRPIIAVVTQDLRFAKRVIDEARRRGIDAKHFNNLDEVSLSAHAIIAKKGEIDNTTDERVVLLNQDMTSTAIIDKAIEVGLCKRNVRKAVVVIDPGKKTGVAFFADEILLRTETYYRNEVLSDDLADFFKNHVDCEKCIYVGEGAPQFREQLISHLTSRIPEITPDMIKILPEKNSSRLAGGKDEIAATVISRMRRSRKGL